VVDDARAAMADFLNASSVEEIVIGANMTTLTYHMSRTLGRTMKPGDEIIVTRMDHEGNVSPWLQLAEDLGLVVRFLPFDERSWQVEEVALQALLSDKTRLVALNYASNLTGSINRVKALTALARRAGALVYVDAVQFAPHGLIDVQALGCDFLVCSAYKFFGPHMGILWGRRDV
ncbi:MAG: aminotransferase class V-fold PLP-dependent enzyme, partial [Mesorhizobium sp.]